jgi:hypothetical protein
MTEPLEPHPAAELFPLLADDELRELADDIAARGLLEPIWLHDGKILDGRNRHRACQLAGADITTRDYTGDDPIGFVIAMNLHRRHLTTGQKAFLALNIEKMYAAQAAERVGGRPRLEPAFNDTDEQPPADLQEVPRRERESVELAGRTVSVSGRVVAQAKRVHAEAPDLAAKVQAGELAIDRAERIVRDRQAEAGRVARAREDAAQLPVRPTVDIRHGDFRDVLTDIGDVDAVITDPPYGRDYLPLLGDLAKWADQALSPDGILAVLFGQTYLPDVYQYLEGYRPYRWTMAYLTPGAGYASHTARVQSNWKPVLIYGGGPRFADVLSSTGTDAGAKDLHYWGQDYGAFHTLIERLTRPGQTVADPFCGSGTTLLAAHALGRHAIGSDIDADHVSTARERIA